MSSSTNHDKKDLDLDGSRNACYQLHIFTFFPRVSKECAEPEAGSSSKPVKPMTSRMAKLEGNRRYRNRPQMTQKELKQLLKKEEQDRKKAEEMEHHKNRKAKAAVRKKEKALKAPKPVPKLKEGQRTLSNFGFQKGKHDGGV